MALKPVIDKAAYDNLPDALKAEYKVQSKDGVDSYILEVEDVDSHPRVAGLKSAFEKNKRTIEALEATVEKYKDIDPDRAREALAKIVELEEGDGKDKKDKAAELDALKQRLETTHARQIEKLKEELGGKLSTRDKALRKLTIDAALDKAIEEGGFDPRYKKAVRAELLMKNPDVIEEDGEFRGVFKTDLGEVGILDFVRDFARSPEAEIYLPPSGKAGSGADNKGGARSDGGKTVVFDGNDPLAWGKNADALAAGTAVPQ